MSLRSYLVPTLSTLLLIAFAQAASAQAPARPSYGIEVNLETAKKIAAAAMAEAAKNKWAVAVAIVDNHGMLIYYEMMDDTQTAGAPISIEKARTAATFRRPSKDFEDRVAGAGGGVAVLGLPGVTPIDGGLPIVVGGKVIGGVGVSGMAAPQDAVVAKAGLDALN
jgi:glc operon protein GlcG